MKKNEGFSLVELLIVISIVGILSTIVLNSVSDSRSRAYDSKIKQQLNGFRTASEMYFFSQMPNGYGPATNRCDSEIFNEMDPASGSPGKYIAPGNLPDFVELKCSSSETAYAVKATLYSGDKYWCVDSRGASKVVEGPIGGPVTRCP